MVCLTERGTCVRDCEFYGVCHCGCKKRTTVASQGRTRYRQVRGEPFAYRIGHAPGCGSGRKLARPRLAYSHPEVAHFARVLVSEYGLRGSGRIARVHYTTINRIVNHGMGCRAGSYARIREAYQRLDTCDVRLPTAPLFAYLADHGYRISQWDDSTSRRLARWKARGYAHLYSLDEFITSELSLHPTAIYGPRYLEEAS